MEAGPTRPSCTIIGGPNGSGKSRIYELLRPDGVFINADVVARTIDPHAPETVSLAAGRRVLHSLEALLHARQDFVFETTLSSQQAIALMQRARLAGYAVGLVFVVLASVELNVKRVAERVSRGGHDIPEAVIRRRYRTVFTRFSTALGLAHECLVYDNSGLRPTLLVALREGRLVTNRLDPGDPFQAQIAETITCAHGVERAAFLERK